MAHGNKPCLSAIASSLAALQWLIVALLVSVTAIGCGRGDRPRTVEISGLITYGQGEWPTGGILYFLPIEPAEGYPRRAATADFQTDGRFTSPTSFEPGDGVVPGRYKVFVECWKVAPTAGGPPPVSHVAPKYQSGATSDFEVEIAADSTDEDFHWDFPPNT